MTWSIRSGVSAHPATEPASVALPTGRSSPNGSGSRSEERRRPTRSDATTRAGALSIPLVGQLPWDLVSWCGDPRVPRCPMSRDQKDPLRPLTAEERQELTRLSRSLSAPAAHVERARALPSALGHYGWRELHGGCPPGRTTAQ